MKRPYKNLRKELCGEDLDQRTIAKHLGRSTTYVSVRMRGLEPWNMADVYKLLDLIHQPPEMIAFYFPRSDMKEEGRS